MFCMRLELVRALLDEGYSLLISCPDGPKLDLMKRIVENLGAGDRGTLDMSTPQEGHYFPG